MPPLSARFSEAFVYAATLHRDQTRKLSGVPYVAHLLAVAATVLQYGGGEEEAIAGLLHDAVEDQGGEATSAEIARRFGDRVAEIVLECSDTTVTPKPPWRQRKEAYLARLKTASPSARLVKAADKLDNARSLVLECRRLGDAVWSSFRGGREGTLWFFRSSLELLRGSCPAELIAELERTIAELEDVARPPAKMDT